MIQLARKAISCSAILLVALVAATSGQALAQEETAETVLRKALKTYADDTAWHGEVSMTAKQTLGDQERGFSTAFRAAIRRPHDVMVKTTGSGPVSAYIRTKDLAYSLNGQWTKYMQKQVEAAPVSEALRQRFAVDITSAGQVSGAEFLAGLFQEDAADALLEELTALEMDDPKQVNGVQALHVRAEDARGFRSFYLHPETYRILQVRINPEKFVQELVQQRPDLEGLELLYTLDIAPADGAVADATFEPTPPRHAVEVETVRDLFSAVGGRMADFTLPSLEEGKSVSLSDYEDHVVFVDFFATWCGPCRAELPALQGLYEEYGEQDFTILAVNVNEPRQKVAPFVENMGLSMPLGLDLDGSLMQSTGFRSFPTLLVLNRDHVVVNVHQGYRPGMEKKMADEIDELLEEKPE